MKNKKILVIHGFNSSPQSLKAQLTVQYMQQHYPEIEVVVPQILSTPEAAIKQLCDIIEAQPNTDWYFTGSSLGGYFATYLVDKYKRPAVLINPAVTPYLLLADYIGEQVNPHTGEVYQVTPEHMQQLKLIESEICQQKMFFVMVQTGDEVLDYQQAVAKYGNCKLEVQKGGDHSFIHFEQMLPKIAEFFQF
ncbi:YqiA/YcfP family alpha/beta fold hydrolase [Thalassomonas sp. M1454]|uniref:YqiA/YcfP family alpha/beta fold hydrolase n=1 Tax=Thalassomonas sp. M1454 TaxID=2594477 RepID=UPI00117FEDB5|nr:YqiA/YcfP family alpha/beta fold hydrolase [Thalassomonas sp. M1454]TRX53881.1 esterase YqiA [Thalassomonas sp. M1454]